MADREYISRSPGLQSWVVGEELLVQCDDFTVRIAILKNGMIVDHVQQELSRVCWYFLQKNGSKMTWIVSGCRRQSDVNGKGPVVLCVYIFRGNKNTWKS